MKIAAREIKGLIEKPNTNFLAYLFYGSDNGLIEERAKKLASVYCSNLDDPFSVSKLIGKNVHSDTTLLADALKAMTLIGDLRIIFLSGRATELAAALKSNLEYLNPDCRLIITAKDTTTKHSIVTLCDKNPKIASVACYPDEERDLYKLVSNSFSDQIIDINSELIYYIVSKLSSDRAINRNEIEKLILYSLNSKSIDRNEIDTLLGDNTSQVIDKLSETVFNGLPEDLAPLLAKIKIESIQPIVIIRSFQSYLKTLVAVNAQIQTGVTLQSAVSNLRPPVYFKRKQSVIKHSSICNLARCMSLMERLLSLEKQCKTGTNPDPYSLIGQSLLGIAISFSRQRV